MLITTGIGNLWWNGNNGSFFHVECLGSVSWMLKHYHCLDFRGNYLWCFDSAWFIAEKQTFVNISMSLVFLILFLASAFSKTKSISQKIFNTIDSMSSLEVYLHLYMGNCCIVWRLLWNFFFWSIFTFWVRLFRTKLGITTHSLWLNLWRNIGLI